MSVTCRLSASIAGPRGLVILDAVAGQPAVDPGALQLDAPRRRAALGDQSVQQQLAGEPEPVGEQRRAALPVQGGAGRFKLPPTRAPTRLIDPVR